MRRVSDWLAGLGVVAALGLTGLLALAGPAAAVSLNVNPSTVAAGGTVTVSGNCEPNTTGFAISPAFLHDAAHDFAGVGAASFTTDAAGNFSTAATVPTSRAAGSYKVTARCGGGNLGLEASLTVTRGSLPFTGRASAGLVAVGIAFVLVGAGLLVLSGNLPAGPKRRVA